MPAQSLTKNNSNNSSIMMMISICLPQQGRQAPRMHSQLMSHLWTLVPLNNSSVAAPNSNGKANTNPPSKVLALVTSLFR